MNSHREDGVGPAALGVHLGLRRLSLLTPFLEDPVDLGLVVDLHFLEALRIIFILEIMTQQVFYTFNAE